MIVSADENILQLDGKVTSSSGKRIWCVDSDAALLLL
jgi:hypothetical protein